MKPTSKKVVKLLRSLTDSPGEALAVLHSISDEDFIQEWERLSDDKYRRVCVLSGETYYVSRSNDPMRGLAPSHNTEFNRQELLRVDRHNRRAEREFEGHENMYSLSLKEWLRTLDDFRDKHNGNYLCAYCLRNTYHDIEHFVPLRKSNPRKDVGGTTVHNCVPACKTCNYFKRSANPLIPQTRKMHKGLNKIGIANIERVERYLRERKKSIHREANGLE